MQNKTSSTTNVMCLRGLLYGLNMLAVIGVVTSISTCSKRNLCAIAKKLICNSVSFCSPVYLLIKALSYFGTPAESEERRSFSLGKILECEAGTLSRRKLESDL